MSSNVSPRFGRFGGRYVPETLIAALDELTAAYEQARAEPAFWTELDDLWRDYVGRPTPLYHATRLGERAGGVEVYLKREDLNHTGAHKINNTLGQILLARRAVVLAAGQERAGQERKKQQQFGDLAMHGDYPMPSASQPRA